MHNDIAAADGDLRNFHITDSKAFVNINLDRSALSVILLCEQAPLIHFFQDALPLLYVAQIGSRVRVILVTVTVFGNQCFQYRQPVAQLGSVVHVA